MLDKEFVPYQESLELKELGFNEPCFSFYDSEGELYESEGIYNQDHNVLGKEILAPLYQQAFRFLRDNHNLEYQIIKSANGNYSAVIHFNTREYLDKISTLPHACLDEVVDCYSYPEAELKCLRKLIEIVKEK